MDRLLDSESGINESQDNSIFKSGLVSRVESKGILDERIE